MRRDKRPNRREQNGITASGDDRIWALCEICSAQLTKHLACIIFKQSLDKTKKFSTKL